MVQRMGGALGVALMSVVLEHRLRSTGAAPNAFGETFGWTVGVALLAFLPAVFLPRRPAAAQPRAAAGRRESAGARTSGAAREAESVANPSGGVDRPHPHASVRRPRPAGGGRTCRVRP